jgi:hypothetical protein
VSSRKSKSTFSAIFSPRFRKRLHFEQPKNRNPRTRGNTYGARVRRVRFVKHTKGVDTHTLSVLTQLPSLVQLTRAAANKPKGIFTGGVVAVVAFLARSFEFFKQGGTANALFSQSARVSSSQAGGGVACT